MDALHYSPQEGKLCPYQRRGAIECIHKGMNLTKGILSNWSLISLTNSDHEKKISKSACSKNKDFLLNIIHNNQTGFIKGRNILTTIKQIDDMIILESNKESQSIFFSLD